MLLPLLALMAAATIHSDFEGGSLESVEARGPAHFQCAVRGQTDQDGRNRQASWYYFRLDGARGPEMTIDLVGLAGEYNYKPNNGAITGNTLPWYSYDQKSWRQLPELASYEPGKHLTFRFTPEKDRVWFAHQPPYTNSDLKKLLQWAGKHPHARREVVGKTLEGRDMPLLTITNPNAADRDKTVLWLMARQHAWESGTSWAAEGAIRFLLSDDPAAVRLRDRAIFKIFPMADPDGVAHGRVRFNGNGYDLNRNWDTPDPVKMPEITSQREAILDWVDGGRRIHFFLSLHNDESPSDHLDGPLAAGGAAFQAMVMRFHELLEATSLHQRAPRDSGMSTTPGQKGRMAVYQGLMHERKIPALLLELTIVKNPKLDRSPNTEDRLKFGAALVQAMYQAAAPAE